MRIFDGIYEWSGWGGRLSLAGGRCRLRIYDLQKAGLQKVAFLRPMVAVAADDPKSPISVKSCISHIATRIVADFNIAPRRLTMVEYYPSQTDGSAGRCPPPEKFEAVDFTWHQDKALYPRWRLLDARQAAVLRALMGIHRQADG